MEVTIKSSYLNLVHNGVLVTNSISFAIYHQKSHEEIINIINNLSNENIIYFVKKRNAYYFGNSGIEVLKKMI